MTYQNIFPYGEPGWHTEWSCSAYTGAILPPKRENITKLQYVAAFTAIRDDFNPRISSGKLAQQWIVDSHLKVEANNLNFIRMNQKKLAELYQGLADHIENAAQTSVFRQVFQLFFLHHLRALHVI